MKVEIGRTCLELFEGDITGLETDAIVNPANEMLQLGAGVAGAIRRKGGPRIQEECNRIGGTVVGGAAITSGGELRARFVIHAVGPRMGEGDEDRKLESATVNSLKLADDRRLKSIAFPAISTGVFGYPVKRCAEVMLASTISYLQGGTGLEKVVFCLYDAITFDVFASTLRALAEDI